MITLDLSGLAKFESDMEAAIAVFDAKISAKFADFTRDVFTSVVTVSPQWSGNLASNWNYSVRVPNETYSENAAKGEPETDRRPWQVGNDPARGQALARMSVVAPPNWRDTVYITNATPDDMGGYLHDSIKAGNVNLRPVNLVPAQGAIFEFAIGSFEGRIL